MNAEVLGVSPDSAKSHRRFRAKHALPYRLLVDEEHRLADAYGIWKEKTQFGVKYMGVVRTTVILDKDGRRIRYTTPYANGYPPPPREVAEGRFQGCE